MIVAFGVVLVMVVVRSYSWGWLCSFYQVIRSRIAAVIMWQRKGCGDKAARLKLKSTDVYMKE